MELDIKTWDDFVEDVGPRLYRYFSAHCADAEASDLTQESLVRVVRHVREGRFNPDKGNLRMYAFGIAHYVLLETKKLNRKARLHLVYDHPIETTGSDLSPEDMVSLQQQSAQLRDALKALGEPERQIMSLFVSQDMAISEIAALLNLPQGTIKSHIHRAKTKIIQLLNAKRETL